MARKEKNRAGVPHGAGVVVADGRKALILRNDGTALAPKLATLQALDNAETRQTRDIGADRPGRTHESMSARRSAMEQPDYHTQAEQRFAVLVAEAVQALHADGTLSAFVLVAAPRTLAVLRDALPKPVQSAVLAEIAKDLTHHPLSTIEKLLVA